MGDSIRILFLCTGNSCRSQMAEGFLRHLGIPQTEVKSAGIEAHGIDSRAAEIMAEVGIDISGQESNVLRDSMLEWADIVITLCTHADQNCPMLPAGTCKIHWPLQDPRQATGSEEEITSIYRTVRDEIRLRIEDLLDHHLQ